MNHFIRYYILPGAFLQSTIVAGGYGTGREVMEYISRYGAWGGLVACLAAVLVFALVLSLTYEFARINQAYNYHDFTRQLLGPGWIAYEIMLIMTMLLVTAVIAAASGDILADLLPVPGWVGTLLMLLIIVLLNYFGRSVVVVTLGVTAIAVTVVLVLFSIFSISQNHVLIGEAFSVHSGNRLDAFKGGTTFALYNTIAFPVILYSVIGQKSRRQSMLSGLIAGVFVVIPAVLLHFALIANQAVLVDTELPTYWMLNDMDIQWFTLVYLLVLFLTVTQSGVGVLHGLNERIDEQLRKSRGRGLSKLSQALISGSVVVVSALLAQLGIIALIAKGYGTLAYAALAIYLLPLLSWGTYRIFISPPGIKPQES